MPLSITHEAGAQRLYQRFWQHGYPIFLAQPQAFDHAPSSAEERARDQRARADQLREQALHLYAREHHRKPRWPRGPPQPIQPGEFAAEHLLVGFPGKK